MAALDDILAFDDAGAADDIDARHARGQHRVRLLGAEANAPALQEAAPWLSWTDSAGTPTESTYTDRLTNKETLTLNHYRVRAYTRCPKSIVL